jgi:hypothetical protein
MKRRIWVLAAAVVAAVGIVFLFPAIPQNEAYHNFADTRAFLGIPNCLNVVSNALFLIVGAAGIRFLLRNRSFLDSREIWPWFAFFVGVTLTAFGSSWYHLHPDDATLVWDRLPMTIGFMSLVAAVVAERISVKTGVGLLLPLIAASIASVIYWHVSQVRGRGDLRPYALAQFGSLLVLVLLIALFPPRYTRSFDLGISLAFYAIAKAFEAADKPIFTLGNIVSGHTIKHCFAALSAFWILRMLRLRSAIS